jgi:hypothetical protein
MASGRVRKQLQQLRCSKAKDQVLSAVYEKTTGKETVAKSPKSDIQIKDNKMRKAATMILPIETQQE